MKSGKKLSASIKRAKLKRNKSNDKRADLKTEQSSKLFEIRAGPAVQKPGIKANHGGD